MSRLHNKSMCFLLMDINTVLYLGATCTQIRYFLSLSTALEAFIPRVCQANGQLVTSGFRGHCQCTQTHLARVAKQYISVNTDPCERLGFMEPMGGCMGTFPGGSFALFFWWRRSRRRPSSSHHEDRRAGKRAECVSGGGFLGKCCF